MNEHVQLSTDEKLNITNRVTVNTSQQSRLNIETKISEKLRENVGKGEKVRDRRKKEKLNLETCIDNSELHKE